jgi:hypothetical protein
MIQINFVSLLDNPCELDDHISIEVNEVRRPEMERDNRVQDDYDLTLPFLTITGSFQKIVLMTNCMIQVCILPILLPQYRRKKFKESHFLVVKNPFTEGIRIQNENSYSLTLNS